VQALAAGPAPTRSQAVDHSARPTPHPLAQALAAMEGEVLSATGFTVADAETTAAQPAAGQTAPVAAEGDALPDAAALLAARPALSPRADAAVAAAPKSPASITDKSDKTDKKAASADGVAAAPSTASAARPAAAGAKPATGSDAPAGAEVHARSQAPVDAGAADDAFEPAVQMEAAAEARHAEAQAQTRADAVIRGAPETVAKLAAEIARKLEQRNTRFELALDPAGLGGVQVSLEINARGELAAHMSFERPEAAAELRGRAQELQRALEQAGFEVGKEVAQLRAWRPARVRRA
jgi:flagellar hook-length control protein FliK